MRGSYRIEPSTTEQDGFSVVGEGSGSRYLGPAVVTDVEGRRMVVQRLPDRVLIADESTGRVAVSGTFVTKNVCRPPAAVTRYPDLLHYALEGDGVPRIEYHLGSGPDARLGFLLAPDGRRLGRLETTHRAGTADVEISDDLDWLAVMAAAHLTMFDAPRRSAADRVRRILGRR